MKDLLINRIVDAIVASDLLEPEKKLIALEDILQMYKEPDYFEKALITRSVLTTYIKGIRNSLVSHHIWINSKLGGTFWKKMHLIIGTV